MDAGSVLTERKMAHSAGTGEISDNLRGILFLLIFLVMLVLTSITPMLADDYTYCFSFADGARIENISQIIRSMRAHRLDYNGRVFSHGLVQLFLMLPKPVFNYCNAAVALFLILLSGQFFRKENACAAFMPELLMTLALWCFVPDFGQVFLWLDGAINYLWALFLTVLFVGRFYGEYLGKEFCRPLWKEAAMLILSFFAGAYSESFSFVMLFIAFWLMLFTGKQRKAFPLRLFAFFAAACAGFLFLMLSPAELTGRTGELSLSAVARAFKYIVNTTWAELRILYCAYGVILGVYTAELLTGRQEERDLRKLLFSLAAFTGGLGSTVIFSFAAYYPYRAMLATTYWTIAAGLTLLFDLRDGEKLTATLTGLCAVLFLYRFCVGVLDVAVTYKASLERERKIEEVIASGGDTVVLPRYITETEYSAAHGLDDISEGDNVWPNDSIADYYGLETVTGYTQEGADPSAAS